MILTLTPNPSTDLTLTLGEQLQRDSVQRLQSVTSVAGGKGINVSNACTLAGVDTLALFPAAANDLFLELLKAINIRHQAIQNDGAVRTNTTITEPDGTTTKLNGPGSLLSDAARAEVERTLITAAKEATWVVMSGSLPPGAPTDWYSALTAQLRNAYPHINIAVDTSDAPLLSLAENLDSAAPTVIKPNGLELGQIVGTDGEELEAAAARGEFEPVLEAARELNTRGIAEVLVTLGAAGAALVTEQGTWIASPPPTIAVSTVGAGDSTLAGYVMARQQGADYATALANAVAYGSAAASLPGTTIPSPEHINVAETTITQLS